MSKARNIFEEVGETGRAETPKPAPPHRRRSARGAIALWLMLLFALVVALVAVGGMTRLTDSGLSITEWKPVTGALPPMSDAAWEAEFERYRAIPQFELTNAEMTLSEFKTIYWWEWNHRQLGRLVGLVWIAGFLWFLARRQVPRGWTGRLLALGALGGLQGVVGWWMVTSGFGEGMIAVASWRLAVHLGLAFALLGLIAWYVLHLRRPEQDLLQARRQRNPALISWGTALVALAFAQILLGALVAGIDAGRGYIDWPLMGGEFFPSGAFNLEPAWRNFLENPALVQFNHRMAGYLLAVLGALAWWRSRRSASLYIRRAFDAVGIVLATQLVLGVFTVLNAAPWQIAIVHQLVAVALFVLSVRARFAAQYPLAQRIARGTSGR
jgi:heme a synthase